MRTKRLVLPLLVLVALIGMSFAHKFYVSVTNINHSEKDNALQITTRIFIDDLENVLKERYGIKGELATQKENPLVEEYLEKYLRTKFLIDIDGHQVTYKYLGKKYDADVAICYIEVTDVNLDSHTSLTVTNEILTDLFDDQKNLVHVKWKDQKKSFVLIKSDTKGMLKL
ncbi:DUF6702 family protein [Croceivirga sp. JEA036]|uniref:DUF6702 family protein n=1 Tax=Croceivirga sp. JEA036 TaxID=2721162 RepID=UPI00143B9D07|nr:DUF6702 family protein [Croceivirga sp. JEA036]NJB36016.1 hypothetical protein [Croceivirga sp. JEA036]